MMKKRSLALLLSLVLLLSLLTPSALAESAAEDPSAPAAETLPEEEPAPAEEPEEETDETPAQEPGEDPAGEPEEEVITETVVEVTTGVKDNAPEFTSAGPLIDYSETESTQKSHRSSGISLLADDGDSGSTSGGLELDKKIDLNNDGSYTITLEAYATGSSVTTYTKEGVDIVLMLDLSNYMGKAVTREETTTSYTHSSVNGNTKLSSLSTDSNTYFYKDGTNYYPISVTKSTIGWGPFQEATYTLKYTKNGTEYTIVSDKSGNTSLNQAGNGGFGQSESVTIYTRTETTETTTTTTYDTSDETKLNALKTAVKNFIEKVATETSDSRIAIVTYANSTTVESGTKVVTDEALVTVDAEGVAALKAIVENLTLQGGASNSHYAAADAVKIFQAVPTTSDEYNRQRVAILFSAGVPGTGWAEENKAELTTGNSVAQATMTQAYILKSAKGTEVTAPGGNVDGGATWSAFSATEIYDNTVYTGCGATVYCVGLDIPTSGDPSQVDMQVNPYKAGALANEYFWRTSSHRINGTHIYNNTDYNDYEEAVRDAFGETGLNVYRNRKYDTTYSSLYYFYPDVLTRNQTDGYYLTTTSDREGDLAKLNDIFECIADQAHTDASTSTTLTETAVIRDIITPQFQLPKGADRKITMVTWSYEGTDPENENSWKNDGSTTATATIDEDGTTVSVTGFNFTDNWVGAEVDGSEVTYHGKKLVISFTVETKDGFLGGNNVTTNDENSGVYDASGNLVGAFPQPAANVKIKSNAETVESNVYLGGYYGQQLAGGEIKNNTKITIGGVELDLSKENYGLEDWQTKYVDIVVTVADKNGNTYTTSQLTDDVEYTVTVTIKPKEEAEDTSVGTPNGTDGKDSALTGTIHVFKPELTFKDSEFDLGDTAPTDNDYKQNNLAQTRWVHYTNGTADKTADDADVTMTSDAPTLTLTYTTPEGAIVDSKIAATEDIPVNVTVTIGDWDVTEYVAFIHTKCDNTCTDPTKGKFWLHIKSFSLTITKTGADTDKDPNQSFLFTVTGPDDYSNTVVIVGNNSVTIKNLKPGTYTVTEDSGWSWRYTVGSIDVTGGTAEKSASSVSVSPTSAVVTVTFTNRREEDKWLSNSSQAVNLFKKEETGEGDESREGKED